MIAHWHNVLADVSVRARLEDELTSILTPTTTAFLPPAMQVGADGGDIAAWLDARASESDVCTVRLADGTLVGLLILHVAEDVIRIGYLFGEAHWGQGYATELLTGFADWCATSQPGCQLIGGVEPGNKASVRVLQKAGFKLDANASADHVHFYTRTI
ncbi:MAG: GNAT family N-acetyltransferase [Alphaproteobacteria bacterium]|nr:GNAT family N-acetyltransferase [Alphaproteobacteria bacterium]